MIRNILVYQTQITTREESERKRWASMWMSDESVRPQAPVGACFDLLSLSKKKTGALHIPLRVKSCVNLSVLRWAFIVPSGVPPSVGLSVFRRAFRPPSSSQFGDPSSVERSNLCWAFHPPSGSPPSVECTALRPALSYLSGSPYSVGCSALRQALCIPSDVLSSLDFSIRRSVIRWASRPPSSDLKTVSFTRQPGTSSTIWGLCPQHADGVLPWAIWGLCPTSADAILRLAILGIFPL